MGTERFHGEDILVSIITVTYNAQEFLEQTMQSVFIQDYPNIEYIIVDGGSTDLTLDIIKKYESGVSTWISEKDNGIYDAMNKGIHMAHGTLIGMINAGDYYEPGAVSSIVKAFNKYPDVGVFHGKIRLLTEKGEEIKVKTPVSDLSFLSRGMCLYHPTFFVQKDVYTENGLYDTSFNIAADYDFTLRNYLKNVSFGYIDKVISSFRTGGISQINNKKGISEICDSLRKNGYSEDQVAKVYRHLKKKDRKNKMLFKGHAILKLILPRKVLNKIADSINTAK